MPTSNASDASARGLTKKRSRALSYTRVGRSKSMERKRMSKHYAQHEAESRLATPVNGSVPALQGLRRRGSVDDKLTSGRMLMINIEEAMAAVLAQEDTNGDYRITIEDTGPKAVNLPTMNSDGYRHVEIRGWYPMMVLMRELELARSEGKSVCYINEAELFPNPVDLLGGMISESFWDGLVRCMDAKGIKTICADPKNSSPDAHPIIYVPHDDEPAFTYYTRIARELADLNIEVVKLPVDITPEYVNSINNKAGILALAADVSTDASGNQTYKPLEFVVPGGRFNEQYGWDSYFEALGLLVDGRIQLAKNMVDNFAYEIKHYGKILNANRSYYLTRSQPPFLTDMIIRVYDAMTSSDEYDDEESFAWLRRSFEAAITEYFDVWMAKPRYNEETGLSCYYTTGTRMPPETEPGHFHQIIKPYADKLGISVDEYTAMYGREEISEPELDEFFVHDRAVRESGHDTSYRLERRCAHLATIDLNSLLYKYEIDIADSLDAFFGGRFVHSATGRETTSDEWRERAQVRNRSIDRYLWNEEKGLYYDYDVKLREQSVYESVTSLWPLWAGCATDRQAERLVRAACDKFEEAGGLVSGTEESRGVITLERPNRQWDFPYGWAPHQIMAWYGLYRYGFGEVAQRHAYRWLYTIILAFYNHSGTVVEKLDVSKASHKVDAEYGNVGIDFKMFPREGFGWMNASFQIGLTFLPDKLRRALGTLSPPDTLFAKANWRLGGTASHSPATTPAPVPAFIAEVGTPRYRRPTDALHTAIGRTHGINSVEDLQNLSKRLLKAKTPNPGCELMEDA